MQPLRAGSKVALEQAARGTSAAIANRVAERGGVEEITRASMSVDAAAASAFTLAEGGGRASLSGRLEGLEPTMPAKADGYVIWPNALGDDAHVLRRFQDDGFEDFVAFERAPARAELVYVVRLEPNVAGLRLVADSLEFLDAGGAPRLRVSRPTIFSSDGTEQDAHLDVSGCDVDRNPAAPWGRPVVAPGGAECTVRVVWDAEAVRYPALVDPSWVTTGSLIDARSEHTAHLLPSGKVLVIGGWSATWSSLQTAELYDPTTKTWAATGKLVGARARHTSHTLPDGRVLAAGGVGAGLLATSEVYSASTGTWTRAGDLSGPRYLHFGTTLADGRVLVTGGSGAGGVELASAELFEPQTNAWGSAGPMRMPRFSASPITLADGRVLVAGGFRTNNPVTVAEIFNPSTKTWTSTGSLAGPRADYAARLLPDGTVIVAGGADDYEIPVFLDTVEIFNPATGTWRTSTGKLPRALAIWATTTAFLPTGSMVVTGGLDSSSMVVSDTSLYHLKSISSWHALPRMNTARLFHTATALDATRVLVAGGWDDLEQPLNSSELLTLDTEQQAEGAQRPMALSMTWADANMVRPPSSSPIEVVFRNDTGASVTGVLGVVAWTPDGREFRRYSRTITVPPCRLDSGGPCPPPSGLQSGALMADMQNWVEQLNPIDIPSQPVGHEGVFHAEFHVPGSPGLTIGTSNVFYQFGHTDYVNLQLNGVAGREALRSPRRYATPDDYFVDFTPWLDSLETPIVGRVWDGTGWRDMRDGLPKDNEFEVVGGVRLAGPFDPVQPEHGPLEALYEYIYPPKQIEYRFLPADGYRKVCAVLNPDFRDGDRGETYGNDPQPAAYAKASLFASSFVLAPHGTPMRLPIWTGRLDADGCTPSVYLEIGNYTLTVTADMQKPDGTSFIVREKIGTEPAKPATWAVSFRNFVPTINVRPAIQIEMPPGFGTNVAAVAARLLRMERDAPPVGRYDLWVYPSADDCLSQGKRVGAGLFADGIRICPNADAKPGEHNAHFKFVIAHELGHYVERQRGSIPWPSRLDVYTYKDQNLPALCTCNGFVPSDSALHCLQSQEVYAAGSKEGFAHFYASLAWNEPSATSPRFQYYKAFKEPNGTVIPAGGKVVNLRQTPVRWSDTYCPATSGGRSTEYDFLGFYWSINTAPEFQRTTLSEFQAIMNVLKDSPLDPAHEGSWLAYHTAASAVLGGSSEKFRKFFDDGPTFGVNH